MDVIASPPGEHFSKINDDSVAILLTYATARALLAGDAKAREEEHRRAVRTRGLKRLSRLETTKQAKLRFRALLTEGASEMELTLVQRLRPRELLTEPRPGRDVPGG